MNNDIETQAVVVPENELPVLRESQTPPQTTAAQAKTDAIANLTLTAYQKASTLQLTPDEIVGLKADFPDEAFKPGAAGKENLIYIESAFLRDRLDSVIGMGQWALVPRSRWAEGFKTSKGLDGSRVYIEAMLLVRGCFVTEAIGEMEYYPHNASQNYGDACEGAETACLRRCCKKLGIGLQAWKKDWCEGWWQRQRNGNRQRNAPPAQSVAVSSPPKPQTAQRGAEPTKAQPAASQAKRTPKEEKEHLALLEAWLAKCKAELLKKLEPVINDANEYAIKSGMILPNEQIEEISVVKLFPSVDWNCSVDQNKAALKKDFDALTAAVQSFMDGDQIPSAEVPDTKGPPLAAQDEWFMDMIVPIPHKGQKRDEYLKAPDTIRSLFDQRHGTDEDAQLARGRLYGFLNHYQPNGWVKKDGTQMPPSDSDKKFREALDALGEFLEKTGEKL